MKSFLTFLQETRARDTDYAPKIGHVVRTIQGIDVAGEVTKLSRNKVTFRSDNGKVYQTTLKNVRRAETVLPKMEETDIQEEPVLNELSSATFSSFVKKAGARGEFSRVFRAMLHPAYGRGYQRGIDKKRSVSWGLDKENKEKQTKKMTERTELEEGKRIPLDGHPYHKYTDAQLHYVLKDAGEARKHAEQMGNRSASNKYSDQINDAATILAHRKKKMTEETLLELSKGLLKRYIKKAETKLDHHLQDTEEYWQRGRSEKADKHLKLAHKKATGVERARRALGEETLQELSKKTLSSYVDKRDNTKTGTFAAGKDTVARVLRRNARVAAAKRKLNEISSDMRNRYWRAAQNDKEQHHADAIIHGVYGDEKSAKKSLEKKDKRTRGIKRVERLMAPKTSLVSDTGDSVSSGSVLTELSKKTLGRYIQRAASKIAVHAMRAGTSAEVASDDFEKHVQAASKKKRGIQNASRNLMKETDDRHINKDTHHIIVDTKTGQRVGRTYLSKSMAAQNAKKLNLKHGEGSHSVKTVTKDTLTELHKKTLGSYINRAALGVSSVSYREGKREGAGQPATSFKKAVKRLRGINAATKKLTQEETETPPKTEQPKSSAAHYRIYDTHTKSFVGGKHKTRASATRHADKKDLAYGAVRYGVQKINEDKYINELSRERLGSYIEKSLSDSAARTSSAREEFPRTGKNTLALIKRHKGILRAVSKLVKKD